MILDEIVREKRRLVALQKQQKPLETLMAELAEAGPVRDFAAAVDGTERLRIIAEIKHASPAKGIISPDFNPLETAAAYTRGGADAISVLTESRFFGGSEELLASVRRITSCPLLRKDFIIDPYQIYQSRVLGADAILLIAGILGQETKRFYQLAASLGLACLVEVHDREELGYALECDAQIIGINNRNLRDFSVDLRTTAELVPQIPADVIKVSASGIKAPDDMTYLAASGVNAVLIGEALMRAADPAAALCSLRGGKSDG